MDNSTKTERENTFEKAFNDLIRHTMGRIKKDLGEHIYFENNPADPTLPHAMRDVNTATLREYTWLEYAIKHEEGVRRLSKEEAEKIISVAIPTSQGLSETHKKIICSFIPCPCCERISMIVKVSSQGRNLNKPEPIEVDGWYRVNIDALKDGKFKVETYRLEFGKTPLAEKILEI